MGFIKKLKKIKNLNLDMDVNILILIKSLDRSN